MSLKIAAFEHASGFGLDAAGRTSELSGCIGRRNQESLAQSSSEHPIRRRFVGRPETEVSVESQLINASEQGSFDSFDS